MLKCAAFELNALLSNLKKLNLYLIDKSNLFVLALPLSLMVFCQARFFIVERIFLFCLSKERMRSHIRKCSSFCLARGALTGVVLGLSSGGRFFYRRGKRNFSRLLFWSFRRTHWYTNWDDCGQRRGLSYRAWNILNPQLENRTSLQIKGFDGCYNEGKCASPGACTRNCFGLAEFCF